MGSLLILLILYIGRGENFSFLSWLSQLWSGHGALRPSAYQAEIWQAATQNGLDPLLLDALVEVESAYRATAVSSAGAKGLGQLMPGTAADLGVSDPFDPAQNLGGSAKYLAFLINRYRGNIHMALAAYNAGPGNVDACHCASGNEGYVAAILSGYQARKQARSQGRIYQQSAQITQGLHGLPGWKGIDISGGCGAPLYNPLPGVSIVTYNGLDGYNHYDRDTGRVFPQNTMITLRNGDVELTLLHGEFRTAAGTKLVQGEQIGVEAANGWVTGCHSHVILKMGEQTVNYLDYFGK